MGYLAHHGIKGQKWGVRRYQNEDGTWTKEGLEHRKPSKVTNYKENGGVIKRGSTLYRVSLHQDDPTFDNKKYVSTSVEDHKKWEDYLVDLYKQSGRDTYNIEYKANKDLKVASYTETGKVYVDNFFNNAEYHGQAMNDIYYSELFLGYEAKTIGDAMSMSVAAQTETGKKLCEKMLDLGYDAMADYHGANVANDPVIILDPDNKLTRVSSKKY